MILVFGGAAQGQKQFAQELLEKRGFESTHSFVWMYIPPFEEEAGFLVERWDSFIEAELYTDEEELYKKLDLIFEKLPNNAIFVVEDIGAGIVPLDAKERQKREQNGRMLQHMAKRASEVYRVLAGCAIKLKGCCDA